MAREEVTWMLVFIDVVLTVAIAPQMWRRFCRWRVRRAHWQAIERGDEPLAVIELRAQQEGGGNGA